MSKGLGISREYTKNSAAIVPRPLRWGVPDRLDPNKHDPPSRSLPCRILSLLVKLKRYERPPQILSEFNSEKYENWFTSNEVLPFGAWGPVIMPHQH